jgi:tape measure domain-containing protein
MSDDLGTIGGALEIDLGQLRQAVSGVASAMSSIEQAMTRAGVVTDQVGAQMTAAMRATAQGMQGAGQAMQGASSAAGPLAARLGDAGKALDGAGKAADRAVDGLRQTVRAADDAGKSFRAMGETLTKTGTAMSVGITAPLGAVAALGLSFDAMGEQAQVAFTKMLGSGEQATAFLNQLKDFAAATPFEFPDLQESAKRLLAMGFAAKDVVPMLTDVGDAVAGVGGSKEVLNGVVLALGQMQAKGKVSAEEMNQLAERGIPAWKYVADAIGTDIPTAMKKAEAGAIAADVAIKAIRGGMQQDFGGMMAEQSQTMLGVISTIKDVGTQMAGTALLPAFTALRDGLRSVADALPAIQAAFNAIPEPIRTFIVAFAAAAAAAGPLILAAGALMTAMATVSLPVVAVAAGVAALAAALISGNPAIIGATVAVTAWAAAQQLKAIPALLTSIPAIIAQTSAMIANAAATLAAAAPFVVLGAAIAAAIYVYQKWNSVADDAAKKWLEQSPTYQGATAALKRYGEASTEVQASVAKQADELRRLRTAQEDDIKQRAAMSQAGQMESQAYADNTARMNERTAKMQVLTGEINAQIDASATATKATQEQTAASKESARATAEAAAKTMAANGDIEGALEKLRETSGLATEEMDALGKAATKAAEEGAKAFGAAVGSEVGFLADRETAQQSHGEKLKGIQADTNAKIQDLDKDHTAKMTDLAAKLHDATTAKQREAIQRQIAEEKQSYEDRKGSLSQANADRLATEDAAFKAEELKAAEAYAREQAAQMAHLGQMLIEYATAQATMAGVSDAQIAEMTGKLAAQYGVQASVVDRSYAQMTGSIDSWVANGGTNTDAYVANMARVQGSTVAMQQEVDRQIKAMTAQAKADFDAGKLTVEQYAAKLTTIPAAAETAAAALLKIPTRIDSTVTITTRQVVGGGGAVGDASTGRTGPGGTGAALSGTRASGGPAWAHGLFRVAETEPELLAMPGGQTYLLMGAQAGMVIPAMQAAQAALAGQGATMRQAQALAPAAGAAAATAVAAGRGGGGGVVFAPQITINNPMVDTAARLGEMKVAIIAAARTVIGADLSRAVDGIILGGGTA